MGVCMCVGRENQQLKETESLLHIPWAYCLPHESLTQHLRSC